MATTKKAAKPASKPAPVSKAKALTPVKEKSKALTDISDFEGGEGFENVSASDILLPRISILQAMSDQLKKKHALYIEGASVGDFIDLALNKVLPNPLALVPCFFATVYLQWGPRDSGRGLVMNHGTDPSIMKKTKRDDMNRNALPNGDYVVETATYFVLYQTEDGDWTQAFLPLSSTQLKNSRRWMTRLGAEKVARPDGSKFKPHIYYRAWIATPVDESNAKGDWVGWSFEPGEPINDIDPSKELLAVAKEFCHQAKVGLVKGDVEGATAEQHSARGAEADDQEAF